MLVCINIEIRVDKFGSLIRETEANMNHKKIKSLKKNVCSKSKFSRLEETCHVEVIVALRRVYLLPLANLQTPS